MLHRIRIHLATISHVQVQTKPSPSHSHNISPIELISTTISSSSSSSSPTPTHDQSYLHSQEFQQLLRYLQELILLPSHDSKAPSTLKPSKSRSNSNHIKCTPFRINSAGPHQRRTSNEKDSPYHVSSLEAIQPLTCNFSTKVVNSAQSQSIHLR